MFTRLKSWRQARQERKRERLERDYGHLSKQEQEHARLLRDQHSADREIAADPGLRGMRDDPPV